MKVSFRTIDLARAAGISVQQVRTYEAQGLLPAVERSASGYRRYTRQHLEALQTVHLLVGGYGAARTQQMMQAVYAHQHATVFALIDERHAELARTRAHLHQTLAMLQVLAAAQPAGRRVASAALQVGEAAAAVGVPVSTVRVWEREGLVRPHRDRANRYRLFDERMIRRLQIVALLRQVHYGLADIRATLAELESGHPQQVTTAIEQRRAEIDRTGWRCMQGIAMLHAYIQQWHPPG